MELRTLIRALGEIEEHCGITVFFLYFYILDFVYNDMIVLAGSVEVMSAIIAKN